MAPAIQYLVLNSSGTVIGAGASPDGTLPPATSTRSYVLCSATEAQNWSLCTVYDGVVTQGAPMPPTLAQQAAALLAGGITITSTQYPSLNGTYSTAAAAQSNAAFIAGYIANFGKFPGASPSAALTYLDATGNPHVFPTTAEFLAFYQAAGDFVADCQTIILTNSGTLPPNTAAIP